MPVKGAFSPPHASLRDAGAAKEWLAARAQLPDVLLTDVVMPGPMDGLALAQHARQQHPGRAIVLMTGHAEQIEMISKQGFHIIPKPCSEEMLADALTRSGRARLAET